ncbi:MAG TPA: DUF308 domain-containing protein [Amnibacterium sp.]
MTTPTQIPYTATPSQPPKNRAGLIALILGIVGVVLAFIPFLSYVAWVVGLAAVIVGIVGAVKAIGPKGGAITGIVLGVVAIILSIVMSVVYTAAFFVAAASSAIASSSAVAVPADSSAASPAPSDPASTSTSTRTVTYSITGDGKATNISYLTVNNGEAGQEQVTNESLPWKKVVSIKDDSLFQTSVFSLVAQNSGSGKITCEIQAGGKVISKHTSSGQYSVVTCSGSAG